MAKPPESDPVTIEPILTPPPAGAGQNSHLILNVTKLRVFFASRLYLLRYN